MEVLGVKNFDGRMHGRAHISKSGLPLNIGHTYACGTGWLTCLDVGSGRYWQANQHGETRSKWLD
jgi:hypothetical protein